MKDPYNVIITGVGGQGNVLAARMLGNIMAAKGYNVTIGETFGASQRGGSVMSHLRISAKTVFSPQIPKGQADLVVSLEPAESIRVMAGYGNPQIKVLSNTRAIYPVGVICGESNYPPLDEIKPVPQKNKPAAGGGKIMAPSGSGKPEPMDKTEILE